MPQIDLSSLQSLNSQIDALENTLQSTPPGPAHDIIAAQIVGLHAQQKAVTDNMAKQSDMMNNIFTGLGVLTGLGVIGGGTSTPISSIISIFRK